MLNLASLRQLYLMSLAPMLLSCDYHISFAYVRDNTTLRAAVNTE